MEKISSIIRNIVLILIVVIIAFASILKFYNNHMDNKYKVVRTAVEVAAKKCFLENICTGDSTTLGFLINNGYIKEQVEPVTKEYISKDIVITYKDNIALADIIRK